jgi:ribosomal protein S5
VLVGNGMGGAGFGIGKHLEAAAATKIALANAQVRARALGPCTDMCNLRCTFAAASARAHSTLQRDMIHVSTHKGQLFHDLIGKRHSVYVIIRTRPSTAEVCHAPPLVAVSCGADTRDETLGCPLSCC